MLFTKRLHRGPQSHFLRFSLTFICQCIVVFSLILTSASTANASNALRYMPEDALGFVLVRNLDSVDAKVGRFTQLFDLAVPSPLTFVKFATGLDEGLRRQGDLLIALLPGTTETPAPQPMVLLPVKDYAKFAASIYGDTSGELCRISIAGEDVLTAKFGEYAVLMNVEHRGTLELLLGLQQAPVTDLKPLDSWLDENDVIFALMPNGLEELLKQGNQAIADQRKQVAERFNKPRFATLLRQGHLSIDLSQWLLDSLDTEVKLAAIAVSLDEHTNLSVSKRVLLRDGSKLAASGAISSPTTSPLLGYPDQPYVLAGGGPLPKGWAKAASTATLKFMQSTAKANGLEHLTNIQWHKLETAYVSMTAGLKSFSVLVLPGTEGDPLFGNLFGVAKTADPAGYLDAIGKAIERRNEVMELSTSDLKLQYKVTPKTVATLKARELLVNVAAVAQDPNVPAFDLMLKAMFGEDGKMYQFLVAADKQSVVYGMAKEEQLIPFIEDVQKNETGLRDSPDALATIQLSPAESPWQLPH